MAGGADGAATASVIEVENPATAETIATVADPRGELHDTPGVWIGDASAFPSPSGTNPMLTIMALARRTAQAIVAAG